MSDPQDRTAAPQAAQQPGATAADVFAQVGDEIILFGCSSGKPPLVGGLPYYGSYVAAQKGEPVDLVAAEALGVKVHTVQGLKVRRESADPQPVTGTPAAEPRPQRAAGTARVPMRNKATVAKRDALRAQVEKDLERMRSKQRR